MRLPEQPRTMSTGSGNFLLVPIPEYPGLDCVPNKNVKIVVLGASSVGKTGNCKVFSVLRYLKEDIWCRKHLRDLIGCASASVIITCE